MQEWEKNFRSVILERGWDYAQCGAVTDLEKSDNTVSALVRGSEYYKVQINYADNEVIDGYCTCPYAAGGDWCKHMAAVLYSIDHDGGPAEDLPALKATKNVSSLKPIEEILADASRSELESMLLELSGNDDRIESYIRASFDKSHMSLDLDVRDVKREIDGVFYAYSDRSGFIDYHNAFDFETTLNTLLRNRIGAFIDNDQYTEAFDASMYTFIKLGNWDIDDDGEISSISSVCYGLWKDIIAKCSLEERETIREWFEEHSNDGTVIDYMEDTLQDFIKYEMADTDELKAIVEELEKKVENSKGQTKCDTVFTSQYGYSIEAIELRNIFAKRLGATDEEIEDYMSRYMSFRSVREYFMSKADDRGDIEEEIKLLNAGKKFEKDSPYMLHKYSKRLIELYSEMKEPDLEKKERREDILANQDATLEDFNAYRKMCTYDEWKKERLKIIKSRNSIEKKCEFLAEEQMLESLFDVIWEQKDRLALLNRYGFLLAEGYSKQILDFYSQHVSYLAERACNRSRYNELIKYLKRMAQYPGGKELTRQLSLGWIEEYPTRKVMVEELRSML